ncbi:hypothetical protein EJ04DRAFT_587641 [Polyplosphaeria fusca]|uniref:Uncharacterized protein n=1 Tax=Polyplosphaeria fusca TaxID=682080 RepID=A0A9P4UX29_9PLEO|nr:hypothetical protein EJ04DRAFT_587641 [Polyplosphaeria fusca]
MLLALVVVFALLGAHAVAVTLEVAPLEGASPLVYGFYSTPEVRTPIDLEIVGTIPSWIKGSLYRGAQGAWDAGNYTSEHWFDGFSRNHRFEIANGKVSYRSRNSSSEIYDYRLPKCSSWSLLNLSFVRETGLYPTSSFAGDPCKVILGAFQTTFRDGSSPRGNTSSRHAQVSFVSDFPGLEPNSTNFGTLVTTTDKNVLGQIDVKTLEPIELFTYQAYNQELKDDALTCSHPAHGKNGEIYNYVLDVSARPPVYKIFKIQGSKGEVLATISDAPPAYIHTLFSSENYLVSIINTFEDSSGDILIDISKYQNTSWLEKGRLKNIRSNLGHPSGNSEWDLQGVFYRYKLPGVSQGKGLNGKMNVRPATIDIEFPFDKGNIELPTVNQKYRHKNYRYAYGVHLEKRGYFSDSIIKVDTWEKTTKLWNPSNNHFPSEPVFVARPGATEEDDGVLLLVALRETSKTSNLIVLNATTMDEIGRARLPIVMGCGFHGTWGEGREY